MATFNLLNVGTRANTNTGLAKVARDMKVWVAALLVPRGTVITATQAADLKTYLTGASTVRQPLWVNRWHLIGRFRSFEDQSAEENNFEFEDGSTVTMRDAFYRWMYRHNNGEGAHKSLLGFKGKEEMFDVIGIDKDGYLIGTEGVDADGQVGFAGLELAKIHVPNKKAPTFGEPVGHMFGIELADAAQLNEYYMDMAATDVNGTAFNAVREIQKNSVQDVVLQNVTPSGAPAGVFTVFAASAAGQESLVQTFGSAFTAVGNWVVTNAATGAAITVSSVAASGDGKSTVITLSTVDPDYPATGNIAIKLASITTLATAGLKYFESNTLLVPRS